ncbi:MAG: MFS transporter [Pseudomonadota bacterium]
MFKSRTIAWSVWMTASIFYAYQYIIRVMPNIMLGDIMNQFHIDAAVFGQFSGIYYIGYSLMHLPIGIMLDRYGPKNVMSGCILLTVVGLLPILFAEHWVYPLVGRLLIGIGSSAAILGTFKIIRMAFVEKYFTRMLSLSVTIGLIGAIYGGAPVSYMCAQLGYKAVVEIFAMLGLALAVVTYVIVPKMESTNHGSVMSNIKLVLTNRKVITICLLAGLMVGPLEGFADVWGAEFLKQVYGYDGAVASYLPSMIFIGMCFGAPVLSLVAEKTGRYVAVIAGAGIVMLATFGALVAHMLTVSTMTISFVCVGICCAYQILAIYKASTYVPEHVAGLTTAVANMIIMIFGWVFHTVIGCVIHSCGGTKVASAFVYGIGVIPATLAVSVIGFLMIARTDQKVV